MNDTVAIILQRYITNFAEAGTPNGPGAPNFPLYGAQSTLQNLNQTFINQIPDPTANERCAYLQKGLFA